MIMLQMYFKTFDLKEKNQITGHSVLVSQKDCSSV